MIRVEPAHIQGKKTTCACVMIIRDEEKTIRQCLDSVLRSGCFEQVIIVLDSRSKDSTASILREYSRKYPEVKVLWYVWKKQDYSAARNAGLMYAKTDYAFWIDGNEVLLDGDKLYRILLNPGGKAYYVKNLSKLSDGGILSVPQVKLFPLVPGVRFELPVHEQVAFNTRRLGIPEVHSNVRVLHLGYLSADVGLKHRIYYGIMTDFLRDYTKNDAKRRYIVSQYMKSKGYVERAS